MRHCEASRFISYGLPVVTNDDDDETVQLAFLYNALHALEVSQDLDISGRNQ